MHAATMRTTYELSKEKLHGDAVTPNVLSAHLGKRWRAERNFWISFITFTLWWCATPTPPSAWSMLGQCRKGSPGKSSASALIYPGAGSMPGRG